MKKKSILFLGGSGFIGSNLIKRLNDSNFQIFLLIERGSDISHFEKEGINIKTYECNLKEVSRIKEIIIENDIDEVIHLVSNLIPVSTKDDYDKEKQEVIEPTLLLINIISELKKKIIFFSSGGMIYKESDNRISESSLREPTTFYGQSKLIIENHILLLAESHELDYLIFRPSNVYGRLRGKRHDQGFIELAVSNALERQPIRIWGTGKQTRDYIHISDLSDIVEKILVQNINKKIINLASGRSYSLLSILQTIEKNIEIRPSIIHEDLKEKQINNIEFDTSFLQSIIQFHPIDLENGIKKYIEDYKRSNFNNE
tara:strand:- start:17222 stop:18166 length:945 start_codon:yes stop_codon:yes gene_type:complete